MYVYTANNPVSFVDPTGHSMEELEIELNQLNSSSRLQKQMRDSYYAAMQYYKERDNSQMYRVCYENYLKYNSDYLSTSRKVNRTQTTYNELSKLQGYLDNEEFDLIDQSDYSGLLLFDNNDVAANGCGYIASIIAAKNLGAKVDVHDAYLYFNKRKNEFLNTGGIRPSVVTGYLSGLGYSPTNGDLANPIRGIHIVCYLYPISSGGIGAHYQCLNVASDGSVFSYNGNYNKCHSNFDEFIAKESPRHFIIGYTLYQ